MYDLYNIDPFQKTLPVYLRNNGLLLDKIRGAQAIYALTKQKKAYQGALLRARRSIDSAEIDIGAIGSRKDLLFVNTLGNLGNMVDSNSDGAADLWDEQYNANTFSISGTIQNFNIAALNGYVRHNMTPIAGHVYYICGYVKSTSTMTRLKTSASSDSMPVGTANSWVYLGMVATAPTWFEVQDTTNVCTVNTQTFYTFDLTAIFGAGNEPTATQLLYPIGAFIGVWGYFATSRHIVDVWSNTVNIVPTQGINGHLSNTLGTDGNFITDAGLGYGVGWINNGCASGSISNKVQTITPGYTYSCIMKSVVMNNDAWYMCAYVKSDNNRTYIQLWADQNYDTYHSGSGNFEFLSARNTGGYTGNKYIKIMSDLASGWTPIQVKQVHLFNLTSIFGKGFEPPKVYLDALIQPIIDSQGYITEMDIYNAWKGWLDYRALETFCAWYNSYLSKWYDQSGNGNHAVQTTASCQPMIYDGWYIRHQLDGILFDGVNDYLDTVITTLCNDGNPFTLHFEINSITENKLVGNGTYASNGWVVSGSSTLETMSYANNIGWATGDVLNSVPILLNTWQKRDMVINATSKGYINGALQQTTPTTAVYTPLTRSIKIGANSLGTENSNVKFKSVVLFNRALSDSETQKLSS